MNFKLLVIMPLYNRGKYVREAIESVLQQTHKNLELVIVDDCSTDNSLEVAKQYKDRENVTILENSANRGCYYSRNKALEYSKDKQWDIFTIHDPDDVSDTTRFREILKEFDQNILGIRPLYLEVDQNLELIKVNDQTQFHGEGQAFYRRVVFQDILGYYDNIRFSGDTDYWWRLETFCRLKNNPEKYNLKRSDKPLYLRRNHTNNLTKLYDWNTDRRNYFEKSKADIREMCRTGNFYRDIFE